MNLPSIYDYNDFRRYLDEYQKARQKMDPSFTRSGISKLLHMPNTRSYFSDIIKGKKLTSTFIERFIGILDLDKAQALFFTALVNYNQADYPDEKEYHLGQLIQLHHSPVRKLVLQEYLYYMNWHNSVIRALLNMKDFKAGDEARIASLVQPPVSVKQVKESIQLLTEMKLIACSPEGYWKPDHASLSSGGYAQNDLVRNYQRKCLEVAEASLVNTPSGPHNISTNILSFSSKSYDRIEKSLQKCKDEIRSIVQNDSEPSDRLYQMTMTLLPLVQPK